MIAFAFVDINGLPTTGGALPILPAGAIVLPEGYSLSELNRLVYRFGAWEERPRLPQPSSTRAGVTVSDLPEGAVMIANRLGSDEIWQALVVAGRADLTLPSDGSFEVRVTGPLPWRENQILIVRGTGSPELAAQSLTRTKVLAQGRINDAIGTARLRYVTDIPGQQTIYTEKQAEARAYLTAVPAPLTLADFPLIAAEVGVTAPTAWQLAQVWANKAVLFKTVAAITEKLRMEASFAIDAAADDAAIDAVVAASLTALSLGPLG